jgi:hypothetical protein
MDEKSADRIFAAMGKPAVRFDQFDKAALVRGLELCSKWFREAVELSTDAHQRRRRHRLELSVSAIKKVDILMSDGDFWCWLSASLGPTVENDRAAVKQLRRTLERHLASIERAAVNARGTFLKAYSPFELLVGAFFGLVYLEMPFPSPIATAADLPAIYSRNSPYIRFVAAALVELGITNGEKKYAKSAIIRAVNAVLNGRSRRKYRPTPGDHDLEQRVHQLRAAMFGEIVPDPFSDRAGPLGEPNTARPAEENPRGR